MDQLLTTEDLSRILRRSIHSIRHDLSRNPRSLPPLCAIPGNRKLWRPVDVVTWLASLVVIPPDPVPYPAKPRSKRGAPTKAERVRQQPGQLNKSTSA